MKLWIRLDVAIRSDPNVAELAARLNLRKAEAIGLCTLVWAAIAEHRPTGDLTGVGISALEDWGCWVPRKGAGAGAFGQAFMDLFVSRADDDPTTVGASGWLDRQGYLVEKADKERARKDGKRRGISADSGGKSGVTERDGTEQDQKPSTQRVRERFADADRPALDTLLSRVPSPESWTAEIEAMLDGMHGAKVSPEKMARAIKDFTANGKDKSPNLRQFRRYVEGAATESPLAIPQSARSRAERLYEAFTKHGFTRNLPIEEHHATIAALSAVGKIANGEQFLAELLAVKPWMWLGQAREVDKEKSISRIAALITPLQPPAAAA